MPGPEQQPKTNGLKRALTAFGRSILWLLRLPLRLLALPFNRELAKLRSQIRAYGEGSIEATSMVGAELRNVSRVLDEELPAIRRRIEALEVELADTKEKLEESAADRQS
jgi:hypothetical protein